MYERTIELIHRVRDLIDEHRQFFNALSQWYKDVKVARRALRALFRVIEGRDVVVSFNGHSVEKVREEGGLWDRIPSWKLPADLIVRGENEIRVHPGPDESAGIKVVAAAIFQDGPFKLREMRFPEFGEAGHRDFWLAKKTRAESTRDCIKVAAKGGLVFRVCPGNTEPLVLSLELLGDDLLTGDLQALAQEVAKRVKKKLEELSESHERSRQTDAELRDLEAYLELHNLQIRLAFSGSEDTTLESIIQLTGSPDTIIRATLEAVPFAETVVGRAGSAARSVATQQRPLPIRPMPIKKAFGFAKVLTYLVVAAVLAAPIGYVAWQDPAVRQKVTAFWQNLTGKSQSTSDIMTALRQSADELGWKRDAESTYDEKQLKEAVGEFEELFAAGGKRFEGPMKYYWVGEKGKEVPEFFRGKPGEHVAWKHSLGAMDLGSTEAAKRYWEILRANLEDARNNPQLKNAGGDLQIVDLTVDKTQGAMMQRNIAGGRTVSTTGYAQAGRLILITLDDATGEQVVEVDETQRRFRTLAAKLGKLSN